MVKQIKDSQYSFEHCIQRYKERYDKDLTIVYYNELNSNAQKIINENNNENKSYKIISKEKITNSNISYIIEYNDNDNYTYFVFETERNYITTFLHPQSVHNKIIKNNKKYKNNKSKKNNID